MAAKEKMLLVRITTGEAPAMRTLLAELTLDVSCGGAQSVRGGGATVNALVEASALKRLRRPGVKIEVLYDVATRMRTLARQIGKGNRFLGKVGHPAGLGRLVKGDG